MNQDLLLKDLCARIPYGVICKSKYIEYDEVDGDDAEWDVEGKLVVISNDYAIINSYQCELEYTKPYLRSLYNMTEGEKAELIKYAIIGDGSIAGVDFIDWVQRKDAPDYMDWLLSHHFDFRGLISLGLALEAPDGMYE